MEVILNLYFYNVNLNESTYCGNYELLSDSFRTNLIAVIIDQLKVNDGDYPVKHERSNGHLVLIWLSVICQIQTLKASFLLMYV